MTPATPAPTKEAILERNRLEYDDAADPYWRLTVYDAVHGGWWLASIGGREALDWIGERAELGEEDEALELGSGLGDTCRYLAERCGCRMTGIEINPQQVEQARERLDRCAPELRARVRFFQGDVLAWRAPRQVQAVYAIDTLMLLEDRQAVLAAIRKALAPGGCAAFADVLAGPAITPEVRDFIWREDGILGLPTIAEQRAQLAAAGFGDIRISDRTWLAVDCFSRVEEASERHREMLIEAKGEERYQSWVDNAGTYRRLFEERALVYALIAARPR